MCGSGGSRQASLARFLAQCTTDPLIEDQAKAVGALAASAGHDDIVDVTVVEGAIRRLRITSPQDLLAAAARVVIDRQRMPWRTPWLGAPPRW